VAHGRALPEGKDVLDLFMAVLAVLTGTIAPSETAAAVFLDTLVRPLFSGALVEAYRRFTGPNKWRIVEAMRVLKAKGGRISEFSHLLGKSYRTLLRWYAKAAGRDGQEAIEALPDAYSGGVKTGYPDDIMAMVLELHREHPD